MRLRIAGGNTNTTCRACSQEFVATMHASRVRLSQVVDAQAKVKVGRAREMKLPAQSGGRLGDKPLGTHLDVKALFMGHGLCALVTWRVECLSPCSSRPSRTSLCAQRHCCAAPASARHARKQRVFTRSKLRAAGLGSCAGCDDAMHQASTWAAEHA